MVSRFLGSSRNLSFLFFSFCESLVRIFLPSALVTQNTEIGTVGNTGNAITTPAHLHYGIGTLIPYPWRIDDAPLGHQKAFYLNPIDYLK